MELLEARLERIEARLELIEIKLDKKNEEKIEVPQVISQSKKKIEETIDLSDYELYEALKEIRKGLAIKQCIAIGLVSRTIH